MEGLAATLKVLNDLGEGDSALARRVRIALTSETAKLPALQIQRAQTALPLGGKAVLQAPRMAEFPGAFLLGLHEPTIRVDAAQHCLSAMIMLERDRLRVPLAR